MAQTCSKCSRSNPDEAFYCHFDGNVLAGHARNGGPISIAHQPFLSPFIFPSGRACRNFDEFALACQDDWSGARDLLQQGYLENFLSGLGRSDLALAAREAAHFPDRDRGLDQLLAKIPNQVLEPPKLRAEPLELNLGTLAMGQERKFELCLENQGMRLVYGSVTVDDCPWLGLGDAPGAAQKLFQFGRDMVIPVHVRGKQLRAGNKPLEGRLVIDSNGGTLTVVVRLDVPIKPYPDGPLSGARSPRQIAEKAKAAPKDAAVCFEKGAVAAWYKSNGWTYPVQGPPASGLGAVQQFFEALGLTPPPRVEINQRSVALQGNVGDPLRHVLEVSSPEKRPVYAHATSDQPWLEVGRSKQTGRAVAIPLVIPAVPNRPSESLTARVTVTSNGNQKFVVPVTLTIGENFNFTAAEPIASAPVVKRPVAQPQPQLQPPPPPATAPAKTPVLSTVSTGFGIGLVNLIPAGLLAVALLGVLAFDLLSRGDGGGGGTGDLATTEDLPYTDLLDTKPRLGVEFNAKKRFGITMIGEPDPGNPKKHKRLTYQEDGSSNNTCVMLDGQEHLFGQAPGKWAPGKMLERAKHRFRWTSVMNYPEKVEVAQIVEMVPGRSRLLDTVLVRYVIENKSNNTPRMVGLRVMLDTFIGANDGVPFRIPGRPNFLETKEDFDQKHIPVYVQAWEQADLKDPGTIAHLGLKGIELPGIDVEPIEHMLICHWPGNSEVRWKWDPTPINEPPDGKDSCVALYWAELKMPPGARRDMAFTYGLNAISSSETGNSRLSLTSGGSFRLGGEFTLTATIKAPQPGQKVSLRLPAGLSLAGGDLEQKLGDGEYTQASWRIRNREAGDHLLEITSAGVKEPYKVRITTKSIFD